MVNIIYYVPYISLLPFLVGAFLFKRQSNLHRKVFLLVTLTIGVELLATFLRKFGNNMPAFHLSTWIEVLMIIYIFDGILNGLRKRIIRYGVVLFVLFSLISLFSFEGIYEFNTVQKYAGNIYIILICLFYFAQILTEGKIESLWREPSFVLASILLFYYAGTLFIFIMGNKVKTYEVGLWYFQSILFIILMFGYTIVLWMKAQK